MLQLLSFLLLGTQITALQYSQHLAVLGDSISIGYDCKGAAIQANIAENWAT